MANNYQTIIDGVQTLVNRDDASDVLAESGNTINWIDRAVRNAELRFYRSAAARTPPFEKFVTYLVEEGHESLAIPSDYFEGRYVTAKATAGSETNTLHRVSPEQILNRTDNEQVINLSRIAYGSNNWLIDPPSREISVTAYYYGYLDRISSVTSTDNTHWLLNNADDLLIYWSAYELSLFFDSIDTSTADRWLQSGNAIHDSIVQQENQQRASFSTPRVGRPYRQPRRY